MSDQIEFVDRYGGNYPDPATMCKGHCEGMGFYPESRATDPLWIAAHSEAGEHECDGWHFVQCPTCNGTGKRA